MDINNKYLILFPDGTYKYEVCRKENFDWNKYQDCRVIDEGPVF